MLVDGGSGGSVFAYRLCICAENRHRRRLHRPLRVCLWVAIAWHGIQSVSQSVTVLNAECGGGRRTINM